MPLPSLGIPGPTLMTRCPSFSPPMTLPYLKTSNPHPAKAVKSLGLRSLAGFMAQPLFSPKEEERTIISSPMTTGSRPLGTPKFLESKMAKTIMRRNMVDITWREKMCGDLACTPLSRPFLGSHFLFKNKSSNTVIHSVST